MLQVDAQETTVGDKKHERHLEHTIKDSHFNASNRDEDRFAMGAPNNGKQKEKANQMPKTTPREETANVGPRKANTSFTFIDRFHCTEIQQVMEKVVMTETQKAHQNLLVKVRR